MNNVQLVGSLVGEVKYTVNKKGFRVALFKLEVDEGKGIKSIFRCTAWEKAADYINQQVEVGDTIGIVGKLLPETIEEDGKAISRYEIHVIRIDHFKERVKLAISTKTGIEYRQNEITIKDPLCQDH